MRETKITVALLGILVFFALGFVLHLLQPILLPLVVAFFLAQLFAPLTGALRRRRVPAVVSIILVLALVSAGLMIFSWILYSSAQSFRETLPGYHGLRPQIQGWKWEQAVEISSLTGIVASAVGSFLIFFNDIFLIILFLVFLLAGSESFPHKLERAMPGQAERVGAVMRNIEEQVRKYLLTKTLINLINGVLVTLLLAAFGVDFPLLWGFLTFLAHYIPNVGGVISVVIPGIFFFLQFSPGKALLVAALNMALQFLIGNAVEPRIMGSSLNLSPLLVLLSLIFWGWLWGAWGMVLAVPITSMIKIVCENIEELQPVAVLMSGQPHR
jgi:predicted PurR-regulated permease PerM